MGDRRPQARTVDGSGRVVGARSGGLQGRIARYAALVGSGVCASVAQAGSTVDTAYIPPLRVDAFNDQIAIDADHDGVYDFYVGWDQSDAPNATWQAFFLMPARSGVQFLAGPSGITDPMTGAGGNPVAPPYYWQGRLFVRSYVTSQTATLAAAATTETAVLWAHRQPVTDPLPPGSNPSGTNFGPLATLSTWRFLGFRFTGPGSGMGFIEVAHGVSSRSFSPDPYHFLQLRRVAFASAASAVHFGAIIPDGGGPAAAVPEPGTLALLALGAAGIAARRRAASRGRGDAGCV